MGKVRQKIDALFDYRGDLGKARDGDVPRSYSPDYSPNNIRRVVISPNGVMVVYHRNCGGTSNRSYNAVEFADRDLYLEEQDKNYKPILRLLANPVVSSCVEEIVVLSVPLSGQPHPNYLREIQLESLVSSFRGGVGDDLKARIQGRFRRLRYYTVMNINFKSFKDYFRSIVQSGEVKKYAFFSDMPALKSYSQTTELAGLDYWKNYDVRPAIYSFDATLKEHFDSIRQRHEAAEKTKAVDEARDKRIGSKIQAVNSLIEDYIVYSKAWGIFYNIVTKEGTNGVLGDLSFVDAPEYCQIYKFKGITSVPKQHLAQEDLPESEALERNEAALKNYKAKFASRVVGSFLRALETVRGNGEVILLKTIAGGCSTTISIPPNLKAQAMSIREATGVEFVGRDLDVTIATCCCQFLRFFVACEHTEPFSKDYWDAKLKR